jgi:alpha-mannosidase
MHMEKLHLIGNAHLDPVWLWRWPQGAAEIKATFASALQRMDETEGYIFTAGAVSYYEWVMENEPAMFEKIRARVEEGRWVPVGGWWVQPDCNLPSGESYARHGLLGQGFLQKYLGHKATVGYNVDSFGHNAGLPQMLLQAGMKYYVMMRPGEHEMHLPTVFWWEGPDGSRVLVQRIMEGYGSSAGARELPEKVAAHRKESDALEMPLMLYYGVGNHGGGPTVATLEKLKEMMAQDTSLIFSDPEKYFADLERYGDRIPVIRGDLQHHASGCYSTDARTKADNRRAENELVAAEKMMTATHHVLDLPYYQSELTQAWKNVLFNQFHDIMGGCSLRVALQDAHDEFGEAHAIAKRNLNRALQKIAWNIDTQGDRQVSLSKDFDWSLWEMEAGGAPIVVFNTLPWEVTAPVTLHGMPTRLEDDQGEGLLAQLVRAPRTLPNKGDGMHDTMFMAKVPAMGYRVYRASRHLAPLTPKPAEGLLQAGSDFIENDMLRVEVDEASGSIAKIIDKSLGVNILSRTAGTVVIEDSASDTWAHAIFSFREERGFFGQGSVELIETGPLQVTLRLKSSFGTSELRQDITLRRGEKKIYLSARLLWLEEHAMAKLCLPLSVNHATAAWEQAYTVCEKQPDGREMPAQNWGDVTGELPGGQRYGLSLANDSKYSYDALDGELRLTMARSAAYADHAGPKYRDDFCECMDLGEQFIRMVLIPHEGGWQQAKADTVAQELNNPLITLGETYHKGPLAMTGSFAHVTAPSIRLSALKMAEDGKDVIVRCWETQGQSAQGEVELTFMKVRFPVKLTAFEVATFRVTPEGKVTPVNFMEEEINASV